MATQITITAAGAGDGIASPSYNASFSNGTDIVANNVLNLVTGNNTIAVPTGAISCMIRPPASNTVVIRIGTGGPVGSAIHPTNETLWTFNPAVAEAFIVNVASNITGVTFYFR